MPLPATGDALLLSAALGRQVAALLDTERDVPGVTAGTIAADLRVIGVVARVGGGQLDPAAGDLAVTAGWGHSGREGITMPGKGRAVERAFLLDEQAAILQGAAGRDLHPEQATAHLGAATFDIFLNDRAYWRNIPTRVWDYTIGGYQVIKKWLSYRERDLLGRALLPAEAREVTQMARRIAAILLLEPALDANYRAVAATPRAGGEA